MDDAQNTFQLFGRGLDPDRKGNVVGHGLQIAAQVTVLVDAPDQVDGQAHVALREVAVAQLLHEVLLQRTAFGQIDRALLVILREVVDPAFVRGSIVLTQIFVHGDLLRLLLLVLRRALLFLQDDVVLDLLLDALFELHGGQLQQLDHLNLLRRELLLKRKYLFLIDCHIESKLRISFLLGFLHIRVRVAQVRVARFITRSGLTIPPGVPGGTSPLTNRTATPKISAPGGADSAIRCHGSQTV